MKKTKKAIFPGSFNPIHNGHISIINTIAKDYDHLYVLVANNENKKYANSLEERAKLVKKILDELNIENVSLIIQEPGKLTPDIAKKLDVTVIIRGLHSKEVSEYESQLAELYLDVNENLYFHYVINLNTDLSSTIIRKLVKDKKSIDGLIPKIILREVEILWKEGN